MTTYYYRILKVNEKEHTLTVRYWTDELSEEYLKQRDDDHEDPPQTCRTDYYLTMWDHEMTPEEIHQFIVQNCPKAWFKIHTKAQDGESQTMKHVKEMLNINKEAHLTEKPLNASNGPCNT